MARQLKFLTGTPNETRQRQATKHEKKAARSVKGIPTISSGAKGMKGDVWSEEASTRVMIECKSTLKQSLSIKVAWLLKLVRAAVAANRAPRLHLEFTSMPWADKRHWVCLPESDYLELCERAAVREEPTQL